MEIKEHTKQVSDKAVEKSKVRLQYGITNLPSHGR